MHVISNNVKNVEKGKAMMFYFTKLESITPSGLPARVASSSYLKSNYFKNRPSNWYYTYTSPDELTLCPDNKQNLYCHLLCGLVQRNEYVPTLNYYSNDMLPLISTIYASSETQFGLNLNPMCKPEDVSYTFMPNVSYFEFIPVDGDKNNVVDLADVKLGCSYEAVVTNFRIRVGDILVVTGFHNKAPQFRSHASYADISTVPGHYVVYWEVKDKNKDKKSKKHIELKQETFSECCLLMEDSLDEVYKNCRFKEECRTIGDQSGASRDI
ncbi:unnamed protein product [Arabidopsis lyrata]|nr:unnamed protein product [Arabidopsis lyrata]